MHGSSWLIKECWFEIWWQVGHYICTCYFCLESYFGYLGNMIDFTPSMLCSPIKTDYCLVQLVGEGLQVDVMIWRLVLIRAIVTFHQEFLVFLGCLLFQSFRPVLVDKDLVMQLQVQNLWMVYLLFVVYLRSFNFSYFWKFQKPQKLRKLLPSKKTCLSHKNWQQVNPVIFFICKMD